MQTETHQHSDGPSSERVSTASQRSTCPTDDATPVGRVFRLPSPERMAEMSARAATEDERERQRALVRQKHESDRLWSVARVPLRHADRVEFSGDEWASKLTTLDARRGVGFLVALHGQRGTGKTQLAVELIRRSCAAGRPARYTTAMEFFIAVRETYRRDSERSEREVLAEFAASALLVIDELHERGESTWEDRLLGLLIDTRYRERRDTLIVTNLTRDELLASVGPSVASRMKESGSAIECKWGSFRRAEWT